MRSSSLELERVRETLLEKYSKITPTGRLSKVYADRLYGFVMSIFSRGLKTLDDWFTSEKYKQKALKDLQAIGIDKAYMQKWHKIYKKENPPQELIFVELDFSNQLPADYVAPKSRYEDMFKEYLQPKTKLKIIK